MAAILEPGRPGDLLQLLRIATQELKRIRKLESAKLISAEEVTVRTRAIAATALEALFMWLGLVPVADDGAGDPDTTVH